MQDGSLKIRQLKSGVDLRASGASPFFKMQLLDEPPALLPGCESIETIDGRFFLAHVKSRCEKALARDLLARRIPYFLPLRVVNKRSGRERYTIYEPIFKSYIFIGGDDEIGTMQATVKPIRDCVLRTIGVKDQAGLRKSLHAVQAALLQNPSLESSSFSIPGKLCRICSGVMEGVEGRVVQRGRDTLIQIEVKTLGQWCVCEVDESILEPIDEPIERSKAS